MNSKPPVDPQGKPLTANPQLLKWVSDMAQLTKPDAIHWVDGVSPTAMR